MEQRRFGATKREVAVIGQGTWHLEGDDRASAIALRWGLDLGMTHIDTAEMYGSGTVEKMVAEAIGWRRDEVFLVSEVLARPPPPLEDSVAALEQLQRRGMILSWGVSNFDVPDLDAVREIAGEGQLACNQVVYHLMERAIEHAVIPWCEAYDVAVLAYSPFGSGRFPAPRTKGGRVLHEIAAAHRATARQVALRFLVQWPMLFAIPKVASPAHTADNAGAGDLELTDAELARIDEAFPRGPRPRDLPTL
jgi:diketogulonate reductase-like aldo/keto reductase